MQRGLISDGAREKRGAILFQRDSQTLKPVCPLIVQVSFESDLIDHGLTWGQFGVEFV